MIDPEDIEHVLDYASTHAEAGRDLDVLNVRIRAALVQETHVGNLLALAQQVDRKQPTALGRSLREKAAALLGVELHSPEPKPDPKPEPTPEPAPEPTPEPAPAPEPEPSKPDPTPAPNPSA